MGYASLLCGWGLRAPARAQFTREITLTVAGGVVTGGPHIDFPVFVDHTDPELRCTPAGPGCAPGGSSEQPPATTSSSKARTPYAGAMTPPCPLSHEIESYDGIAGRVRAWVACPRLLSDASFTCTTATPASPSPPSRRRRCGTRTTSGSGTWRRAGTGSSERVR